MTDSQGSAVLTPPRGALPPGFPLGVYAFESPRAASAYGIIYLLGICGIGFHIFGSVRNLRNSAERLGIGSTFGWSARVRNTVTFVLMLNNDGLTDAY